ncbi:MAG: PqqD family protein, partial [Rhodoferax sp.]|nr:PqqD family protein [Rhodoferax sp.]
MSSVHSNRWHRVARLRPRLSSQLRLRRQQLRGETWYLMADPGSGRSVRLNRAAYGIAARLDGRRTMQQLWDLSLQRDPEAATQDEVIELLAQLREAALVQFDEAADFDAMLPHLETVARPRGRANLLAWRIPLGNPAPLLRRLEPLQNLLFSRTALWCWIALQLVACTLLLQHATRLWEYGQHWMASPRFVLFAALAYLPIKLVHELAHGLAVRRWGGQVRQAGVTLMLLMPVPYVDASAATSFPERRARIAVSAA